MTTAFTPRERTLIHAALDLPPEARGSFVAANFPDGPRREEALALLARVETLDGFLEAPLASTPIFDAAVPARIGDHSIERVLGWGSMGVVYLARQSSPARTVALKVLRVDCPGASSARRFEREVEVLARLSHRGIATLYEAGVVDLRGVEQPWYSMEYVEGVPLTEFAQTSDLDVRARVRLIVEVAHAVQHAHDSGVVHRDLKPENVLVDAQGEVRVLDFGVAALVAEEESLLTLTATGQVVGTLAYMAPEQARGGRLTASADQFAIGAMLYELLTGELPFPVRGRLPHEALRVIADGAWTPPTKHAPELDGDLAAVLSQALAPEPSQRYASVGRLAEDLGRWLDGRPVRARPPSAWRTTRRLARRYPFQVGTAAALLLLLGGAAAFVLTAALDRQRESYVALLFSDLALFEQLEAQQADLWPAVGAIVPELDRWIADAGGLVERLVQHRSAFEQLSTGGGARATTVESELGERWLLEAWADHVANVERFAAPGGRLSEVQSRRAASASLWERTVGSRRDDWDAVRDRVLGDERFGFPLDPQEGLVPLGPDPESGLEEFALFGSGAVPVREGGRIDPVLGEALVLVLVPGGLHRIGAQAKNPDETNYWTGTNAHEGPPFQIRLDPFLIGKYEVTQDQWTRWTGGNPSDWEIGAVIRGVEIGPLHPVETVSWEAAKRVFSQRGLALPTEVQWEVAARAGSPWPYVYGRSSRDLAGCVNANTYLLDTHPAFDPEFPDDGAYSHLPVGSFRANDYGLHDVLGNVWELCLDVYKVDYHALPHRAGDGLVLTEPDGDITIRGGSAAIPPLYLDVFDRGTQRFNGRSTMKGLRPVRALVPSSIPSKSRPSPGLSSDSQAE